MNKLSYTSYVGDFETTVFSGQVSTEVWASAIVPLGSTDPKDVKVFNSINETYEYLTHLPDNTQIFYHNLKFDGEFYLWYLMNDLGYKLATRVYEDGTIEWKKDHEMRSKEIKTLISAKGQFYTILIKKGHKYIRLVDSYKLLPFSISKIGSSFKTKHQKTEIEYTGRRYAGCDISKNEIEYIKNDVLVPSEALNTMFELGHTKLTIGSCCLAEYKQTVDDWKSLYPNIYNYGLDKSVYGYDNAGEYILQSYFGGWCYVVEHAKGFIFKKGLTLDVTSLYPSRMHSSSGCYYPVGTPNFWTGEIPPDILIKNRYFFIRFKCRFKLKKGYLPFIHIRNDHHYPANENLKSSDVYDKKTGKYSRYYKGCDGNVKDTVVTMTLTCTDYKLFKEHYEVYNEEVLDGCWFFTQIGLFDEYIDKFIELKNNAADEVQRNIAKLFLNNLYGKFAMSTDSSFKYPIIDDNGVHYGVQKENDKKPGYIPIGSAITSYAREFTIRHAQANYREDLTGFIYADTDSCHCACGIEDLTMFEIAENKLNTWKLESTWDKAVFLRQKTYIEHTEEGYQITCAGMPDRLKETFKKTLTGDKTVKHNYEKAYMYPDGVYKKRTLQDFAPGLSMGGKLRPSHVPGGVLLVEEEFTIK